jgi:hydroxyacylglutathione hydrolase
VIFTQYYLDCLSQASYLIGDETTGRAVVVDPRRDVAEYLEDAAAAGLTIELIIETHFHADFLSGHLELSAATGASIGYGEPAITDFQSRKFADGERISLGEVTLEVRATPGHTPESISIVVYEHGDDEVPYGVLTGDTLFIGDVGRPDLLASAGRTPEELARQLYGSLETKLLTLPDATRVFPAHGAGSACGKQLSTETVSTIGQQRADNYALAAQSADEFVELVTEGQGAAPAYFAYDADLNRRRHRLLDESRKPEKLTLDEVLDLESQGATVLDTRDAGDFAAGHLRRSINIGIDGRFAEWAGSLLDPDGAIVLVSRPGTDLEAKNRLARIGFDRVLGHLADPERAFAVRPEIVERASRLTVDDLRERIESGDVVLIDVRSPGEVRLGTIPGSLAIPLGQLSADCDALDRERPTVVYCASGYRSSTAAGLLRAAGFEDVSDLLGGYPAWSSRAARTIERA